MNHTFEPIPRRDMIRDPMVAAARKKLADAYRARRKEDPALARLLFKRFREVEAKIIALPWGPQ